MSISRKSGQTPPVCTLYWTMFGWRRRAWVLASWAKSETFFRLTMLDKGKMLLTDTRQAFKAIRDTDRDLTQDEALIRQFLRGDAEGPITSRKQTTGYEEDLLGIAPVP